MNAVFQLLVFCKWILVVSAHKQVCYPPYGCFSYAPPHNDPMVWLPEDPRVLDTEFMLYTRTNKDAPIYIDPFEKDTIKKSGCDWSRQTIFIVHGFNEKPKIKSFYVNLMVEELLKKDDVNVFVVIWSRGARGIYHQAAGNTRIVGAQLSYLMEVLHAETTIPYSKFHLIGFSLGAHVSGYAGQYLKKKGIALGRISGLDPAGPFFEFKHPDTRLDKTDADFVDAIHTDTKTLVVKGFGTIQAMGDVDFYPNGGYLQPGCLENQADVTELVACNHFRGALYYKESINSALPFNAYPCKSYEDFAKGRCTGCPTGGCPHMGYDAVKQKGKAGGSFYLKTNKVEPFRGYHYAMTFKTGRSLGAHHVGKVTVTITTNSGVSKSFLLDRTMWVWGSSLSVVVVSREDLSDMHEIKVKQHNRADRWQLRYAVVKPMWKDETYSACFNRWLRLPHDEAKLLKAKPGICGTA